MGGGDEMVDDKCIAVMARTTSPLDAVDSSSMDGLLRRRAIMLIDVRARGIYASPLSHCQLNDAFFDVAAYAPISQVTRSFDPMSSLLMVQD